MTNKKLYKKTKTKMTNRQIYLYILIATILSSIASYYFIFMMELYTPGLAGIINGIVFTTQDLIPGDDGWSNSQAFKTTMYWILYLLANIPIIYLTLRWYSLKFFKLSMMQFTIMFVMTMFLTYTPGFSVENGALEALYKDNEGQAMVAYATLALLAGLLYGVGNGMIFKVGACTMGLDPVMRYFSRERDKNIGPILFGVTIINTTLWTFVRYFTADKGDTMSGSDWENFIHGTLLSKEYVASWIYVGVFSFTAGSIYASNKKAEIIVKSEKVNEISKYFNEHRFHRGHTLLYVEGGYTHKERKDLQMIINYEEMHDVVDMIAAIDPNALITVSEVKKLYDVRNWSPITEDDKQKQISNAKREACRRERLAKAKEKRDSK